MRQKQDNSQEFQEFDQTMAKILRANPHDVKATMNAEIR